jgi:hypothetical protein
MFLLSLITTAAFAAAAPAGVSCPSGAGGTTITCTVTLTTKTRSALVITLSSRNSVAVVPATVTAPAGVSSVTFPLTIGTVTATEYDVVTATSGRDTKKTEVELTPGTAGTVTQVTLTWTAAVNNGDPPVSYDVFRSTAGGVFATLANVTTTRYLDVAVTANDAYTYYVESVDKNGVTSTPSNSVTVTVP